jgi:hypothetical protein
VVGGGVYFLVFSCARLQQGAGLRDELECYVHGSTHSETRSKVTISFCKLSCRYIQAPLAYPRERKRRMNGGEDWLPLCIYDSSRGGVLKDELQCHWSDYYKTHPREPNNFEFAPWVSKLWKPIRNKEHMLA